MIIHLDDDDDSNGASEDTGSSRPEPRAKRAKAARKTDEKEARDAAADSDEERAEARLDESDEEKQARKAAEKAEKAARKAAEKEAKASKRADKDAKKAAKAEAKKAKHAEKEARKALVRDDDDDGEHKPRKLSFETFLGREEAVAYFEQVLAGLSEGTLELRQGEKGISLTPANELEFEVNATKNGKKERITIEFSWRTDARQHNEDLSIES